MNREQLTGQTTDHILQLQEPRFAAAPVVVQAFLEMRDAARLEGLELEVFSGFRDFNSQLRIWNLKAQGKRPLLDLAGEALDFGQLSPDEVIAAILRWSALPGGSRHHWGSELDLIDSQGMPAGYRVQLVHSEYAPGGVFDALHQWLEQNSMKFGFFRPYQNDRGGVAPEPWHLSFGEISLPALNALSLPVLEAALETVEFTFKTEVLQQLPDIFTRYIQNVCD